MWERAVGTKGPRKMRPKARFDARGAGKLRLRLGPKQVLRRVGQPVIRTRGWTFKVKRSGGARIGAAFKRTKVAAVVTSARRYSASGISPGDSPRKVKRGAESLGGRVWTTGTGRQSRYAFGVGGGEVKWVGVLKRGSAQSASKIKRSARLALRG